MKTTRRTFKIASIFEGENYITVFDAKSGEAIYHLRGASKELELIEEEIIIQQEVVNTNQISLF